MSASLRVISGTVSDTNGPLPAASVLVKGTKRGTQTDINGRFSLQAETGEVLVFSYIGYRRKEVRIGKETILNVVLKQDAQALEEVVIAGRVRQRKQQAMALDFEVVETETISPSPPPMLQHRGHPNGHVNSGGQRKGYNGGYDETYARIRENRFERVQLSPLSTFSIDVDRASYSNIRRMINNGEDIPPDAVKIEEMINYFSYDYPQPKGPHPFSITTDLAKTPWNTDTRLVRIGLQGKAYVQEELPPSNLTFLIDVSGSMNHRNKLPLLKAAFRLLVNQLRRQDRVAIVVYAGAAGTVLPPTRGDRKEEILNALEGLQAGGSTAGGAGIRLAYELAESHFAKNGNNRVILATDGDFNVGASSDRAMEALITEKRESGIFLSVLGFGMGNYKDSKLETLADKGNGNHAYIDTMQEARKVFGEEFGGTLYTIAEDVKIQVEFNPEKVKAYRLLGYENRLLAAEDFMDDTKDAGELGSNHSVTALYEILPAGVESPYLKPVPDPAYPREVPSVKQAGDSWFTVKFRYKKPDGTESIELVRRHEGAAKALTEDFSFAASLALFGMQLRNSSFVGQGTHQTVLDLAKAGKGADPEGYRGEFIRLVKTNMGRNAESAATRK